MFLASQQGLDIIWSFACVKKTSEVVILGVFCTIIGKERVCKAIQSKRQDGSLKRGEN